MRCRKRRGIPGRGTGGSALERPEFRRDSVSPACRSCVPVGRSRPTLVIRCRSGAGCQDAALSPSGYRTGVVFLPPFDYRTPVHIVPWRPLVRGATVVTDAPRPGPGQAWACPLFLPLGPPEAQRQGRAWRVHVPGSLTVRGCPAVTAGLDAEGRSRTLARRVPQPGAAAFPEVSGGEAASFWIMASGLAASSARIRRAGCSPAGRTAAGY